LGLVGPFLFTVLDLVQTKAKPDFLVPPTYCNRVAW
jgi:hypothetical protein